MQTIEIDTNDKVSWTYDVFIDLSIMTTNVTCKNIAVDVVPIK